MVRGNNIEILSIKRIKKTPHYDLKKYSHEEQKDIFMMYHEGILKGRYKNQIKYKVDNKVKSGEYIYIKNESLDAKTKRLRGNVVAKENEITTINDLKFKNKKVAKISTKSQKKKGFYFSSIKISLIVRYRSQTPFHFPSTTKTNNITRAKNLTELQMLNSVLYDDDREQFNYWYKRGLSDKNIHIFGGWTYKRIFSRTGSFNGDSLYIDFYKREFQGSSRTKIVNFLKGYQQENTKNIKIV